MSHGRRRTLGSALGAVGVVLVLVLTAGCSGDARATSGDIPATTDVSGAGSPTASGAAHTTGPAPSTSSTSGTPGSPATGSPADPSPADPGPADPGAVLPAPVPSGIPTPGTTTDGAVASVHSIEADGMTRSWVEYAPPDGTAGRPLLVWLHGTDATVKFEASRSFLLPLVAAGDLTVVYPVGYEQNWNAGEGCCGPAALADLDDVGFVRQVTAQAVAETKADPTRVYLGGYSGGGKVGWQLVCADPGPFAAIGTYGANPTTACPTGNRPLPALIGFGAKDLAEPVDGQPTDKRGPHPPAAVNLRAWRTRDGCPAKPSVRALPDVTMQLWSCPDDDDVVYAVWPKAKHVWPQPPLTTVAGSPARVIWAFLSAYRSKPEDDGTSPSPAPSS